MKKAAMKAGLVTVSGQSPVVDLTRGTPSLSDTTSPTNPDSGVRKVDRCFRNSSIVSLKINLFISITENISLHIYL